MSDEAVPQGHGSGRRGGSSGSDRGRTGRTEPAKHPRPRRDGTGADRPPRGPDRPVVPEGVSWFDLDESVRADLKAMPLSLAERVGGHLAAAGLLVEDDAEAAYAHATEARRLAQRVAVVREAMGLTAYATGRWTQAIAELRAARRLGGPPDHLPLVADAERALGRPERALELAADPAVADLGSSARLEMLIVAAGARRDLGEPRAAVRLLDVAALRDDRHAPELARLRYAYADALLDCTDEAGAREWFAKAAELDDDQDTDAVARLDELAGDRD